jgi:cytidylate kinase
VAVVTVSGEYGTGSEQVVAELARKTGYDHIGGELLKEIADQLNLSESEVEVFRKASQSRLIRLMDRYTCSLVQKVVDREHGCLDDRDFHHTATALVEKLYTAGKVVIHDWGAQCILKNRPDTVHVFLQLDREAKIEAAMQQLHLDFQAARAVVDEQERNSEQYIRQFFNADWKDPQLYDLIIDRGQFSVEKTAQMITDHIQRASPAS